MEDYKQSIKQKIQDISKYEEQMDFLKNNLILNFEKIHPKIKDALANLYKVLSASVLKKSIIKK